MLMLGTATAKITLDNSQFMAGAKDSERAMRNLDSSISGGLSRTGKQLQTVGRAMTMGVTLPIVGAGVAMLKTAMDFESGMNRVKALTGDTGDGFDMLRQQAIDLSKTTRFTATEAAGAMGFLAMAGNDTNQIYGMMPAVLDLAAAGAIDLGRAADLMTNIMQGMGLEAHEAGRAADVLTQAFTGSNVSMEMLGESFKYVGPLAKEAGWSIEQTAAAIGLLGNAGIQGSMAGTSLRNVIVRLMSPTPKAQKAIDALGVSLYNLDGTLKSPIDLVREFEGAAGRMGVSIDEIDIESLTGQMEGLDLALESIGVSLDDFQLMDAATQMDLLAQAGFDVDGMLKSAGGNMEFLSAVMEIFGLRGGPAFLALLGQGSAELETFTDKLYNAAGRAAEVAATMMEGLGGALNILKATWQAWMITLGDTGALDFVTDGVNRLTGAIAWLNDRSPETQRRLLMVLGAVAALGPGVWALGTAMRFAGAMLGGAFLGPLAAMLPVLAIAGAAFGAWKLNLFGVQDGVRGTISAVKTASQHVRRFGRVWKGAFDGFKKNGDSNVSAGLKAVRMGLHDVSKLVPRFGDQLRGLGDRFGVAGQKFAAFQQAGVTPVTAGLRALGYIIPTMQAPLFILGEAVDSARLAFNAFQDGDYAQMWEHIKDAASDLGEVVKGLAVSLKDWVLDVAAPRITGWIVSAARNVWEALKSAAGWAWSGLASIGAWALETAVPAVTGWIADHAGDVWGALTAAAGWAWSGMVALGSWVLHTAVPTVTGWLGSAASSAWEHLKVAAGWTWSAIADLGAWTLNTVAPTVYGWIRGAASNAWLYLKNAAGWAWDGIADLGTWTLNVAVPEIVETGTELIETFKTWIGNQIDGVNWAEVATTVGRNFRNAVTSGVQAMADITAVVLSWINDQIRGVNWESVGSRFAELLVAAIKGVALLVGFAGYMLGQLLLALADVEWGQVASSIGQFIMGAIKALGSFLVGFGSTLLSEISSQIAEIDWGEIGTAIKNGLVGAVKGVGTAMWDAIWGEFNSGGERDPGGAEHSFSFAGENSPLAQMMKDQGGGSANPFASLITGIDDLVAALATIPPATTTAQSAITGFVSATIGVMSGWTTGLQTMLTTVQTAVGTSAKVWAPAQAVIAAFVSGTIGVMGGWVSGLTTMLTTVSTALTTRTRTGTTAAQSSITSFVSQTIAVMGGWSSGLQNIVTGAMSGMVSRAASGASQMTAALRNGAQQAVSGVQGVLGRIPGIVASIGGQAAATAYQIGANISQSFASGMLAYLGVIQSAASQMVAAADSAVRARARIASPSKLFAALGENIGEGFEVGIRNMIPNVARATAALVNTPGMGGYGAYAGRVPSYAYAPAGASTTVHNTYVTKVYAVRSDEWLAMVRQVETAPERAARYQSAGFSDVVGIG